MTTLNFNLTVEGLDPQAFVVREFEGNESLSHDLNHGKQPCHGYYYDVQLASRNSLLSAEDVVDKQVQLTLYRDLEIVKTIHGMARSFTKSDTGHHHTFYALTIVPALERLSLRQNSRIFQFKTVPEILSIILKEMEIDDFAFALQHDHGQREFCVQYRESDLDFLHRLAAEEGLIYSFVFENGKHTVLFSDSCACLPKVNTPIPYNALSGGISEQEYVSAMVFNTRFAPSSTQLKDYSFKKPAYSFQQNTLATDIDFQSTDYQHFDAPGRFKSDDSGALINQTRLDYLRRDTQLATGKSYVAAIQAGYKFQLSEHLDDEFNREWLVVKATHRGTQPQALEEEAGSGSTTYDNQFWLIPSEHHWQLEPFTKPLVDGPMMATVVGPEGEEIYCDEHGRVKVQFPWDRYSSGDEHSSCWIRVSQGWAGNQYGMLAIPRIGHEVIVEFLNGDPDQPIITGRTYHVTNTAPYVLPDNKTKTVIRSESHQGEGFNELSFEDQSQQEQVFVHAQKDLDIEVENDTTVHIKHDQHLTVDNHYFSHVKNHRNETVEGDKRNKVTQDQTLVVEGSLHLKTGKVWVNDSGSEIHIKSGNKVVIEAGSEITLKAAGSFVKVDPAGVHLSGAGVNLNSGGSAGSGSGYAGQTAELATALLNDIEVAELQQADISASQNSAEANVISEFSAPEEITHAAQHLTANSPVAAVSSANSSSSSESESESESEETNSLRLKSALLKQSLTLDKLANRESHSYKSGSKGQEVEYIQQALIKLGFDLGNAGADGDFGSTTQRQVKLFQSEYKPTNETHLAYDVGAVDGIVGQGTLLGLDEALVEGWEYETNTLSLSPQGLQLLKEIEELRLMPYDDQTGKEISSYVEGATIGYGYLIPESEWDNYKNGIDKSNAERLLKLKLPKYEDKVVKVLTSKMNQQEYDALVLLCYNIGPANFENSSVLKLINGGLAPAYGNNLDRAWLAWNKSQGEIMNGLISRRKCELDVFHKGVYKKW
ncbi:type VI secretion system tip protein TssI/VgrG [Vibrio sp. NH-UV-68]|uniref:type VI secretion system tip protein TssI/VgrG n=1 Tax=unclassified Vibrio TaxID=2614977 RepID=UPI0036F2E8A0